ncbi:MAG: hypothetical protein ABSG51_12310, partial [Terracidiphilus sp.]
MIRRLCIVVFVASVAIVAAIVHPASVSAFQEAVFSEFNLSASADLLALGQSTTLSVGPVQDFGGATGDVEFYISSSSTSCTLTESANVIAVVPIGSPTYSWTPGAINPIPGFPVCAVYIPGPGDQYGSDTSGPVTVIVNDAEVGSSSLTQFDLGASPNPLTNGSTATLTANVNGNFGLPTGNILFYVSTSSTSCIQTGSPYTTNEEPVIAVGDSPGDGIATGPYPASSPGTVSICAKYVPFPGSDPYVSSTAGPYLLTVNVYPPNITVGTSPSSIPNGFVSSLTATVTGSHGVPPGTVQFFISDSSTSCASINQYLSVAQVNSETGVATFSYTANGGGTFPICAYYIPAASSDPYSTATSTTPSVLTVTTYPFTSFSLTASPTTLGENNSTTLTVNVSGNDGLPPSYVEFYLSSSSTSCVYGGGNYFGYVYFSPTEGPGSGIATYTYTPGASGPLNICAIYEPDYEDPYGFATTGPTPLTVNPPVALTVLPPTPMLQTQPIAF